MNPKTWHDKVVEIVQKVVPTMLTPVRYHDGKVKSVSGDGKRADIYLNGEGVATAGISVPRHIHYPTTLAANEEVRVKQFGQDFVVDYVKPL